jgi:hypothetical protein
MKTSENINELAKAMSEAQKNMKPASKDAVNPYFKSKYSNISSVWEAIRGPITDNGLTVWQDVITCDKTVSVSTRIVHHSGQWVEFGPLVIPLAKLDAQVIGSATSYAKRYALCAAIGVVSDDDDDGNLASSKMAQPQQQQQPQQAPPARKAEFISKGDLQQIEILLKDNEEEKKRVLAHYKIDSLAMIPAAHGKAIINKLATSIASSQETVEV